MRTIVVLGIALAGSPALAAGYLFNEHDAAATGRGGTFVANPSNPGAIFFNPAGLANLPGFQLYLGASVVDPDATFLPARGGPEVESTSPSPVVPNLFASYRIDEMFTAGVGLYLPFGLTVEWPASSPGRQMIRRQELRALFISPVLAIDFSRWVPGLAIGGGPDLVPSNVELEQDILFGDVVGTAHLGGTGFGAGGRIGLRWAPELVDGLSMGATWRSEVDIDYDGDGDFDIDPIYRTQLPADGPVSTSLTLPQSFLAGVAYNLPLIDLELELDLNWVDWTSYHDLPIDLPGDAFDSAIPKDWNDTLAVRVGAEYRWKDLAVRAGYVYDPTPIPDTTLDFTLPDIDRHVLTAGLGYDLPVGLTIDAAVLRVLAGDNTTGTPPFPGTYEVSAWVFMANLGLTLSNAPQLD